MQTPAETPLQETVLDAARSLELGAFDWIGAAIVSVFLLLGLWRGLWWQVIRLVGLVASVVLARTFSAPWGEALQESTDLSSEVATGAVWLGLFLIGLILTAVLGTLGKKSLEAMQLGLVDRVGGMLAGLATGLLLHTAWLVAIAHLGPQPWTANQLDGTYSRGLLQFVTTRYPVLTQQETKSSDSLFDWLGTDPLRPAAGAPKPSGEKNPAPKVK